MPKVRQEIAKGLMGMFTVEADSLKECLKVSTNIMEIPEVCPFCGVGTYLRYQKVKAKTGKNAGKEFEYVRLECTGSDGVIHSTSLGIPQDDPNNPYFDFDKEWQEYDPATKSSRALASPYEGRQAPASEVADSATKPEPEPEQQPERWRAWARAYPNADGNKQLGKDRARSLHRKLEELGLDMEEINKLVSSIMGYMVTANHLPAFNEVEGMELLTRARHRAAEIRSHG